VSTPTGSSNGEPQVRTWWHIPDNVRALTIAEACVKYHYSRRSIMRKIWSKQLQGFKIGSRWFVVESPIRVNTKRKK